MNNSEANPLRCLCYPQACIPLSYAARIPTTPNPDLANVRVSLSNLDQGVRQYSVRACVRVCVGKYVCMRVRMCDKIV